MPQKQSIAFRSSADRPLTLTLWLPDGEIKAVVQLTHGMAEHIARYERLALALNKAGYAAAGHNHLGHGPEAKTEELGFFAEKNGWDRVIDDMHTVHQMMCERFPGKKQILLGHSMGSFAAREYLLRYGNDLTACVLSGTGWHPKALCAAAVSAAALCGATGGWKKPAPAMNKMGFGKYNQAFEPVRTPFDWLSRDEKEVDQYIADPLCGYLFTARGYYDMFSGLKALSDTARLAALPRELPVLFISGEKDPVGGRDGEGVLTVSWQFTGAGVQDVTVKLYPQARHELFNEINRDAVTADLIEWLDKKTL